VATGTLHSVREFVEIAAAVLRISPDRLRFGAIAERAGEMHHSTVNVSKLESLTGWRPSISPAEGIRRTRESSGDAGQAGSAAPAAT
jgi:nucleoside-diphosphate-sugar epimerase